MLQRFFFSPLLLVQRLRSAKNKQVRAFVQRCNLHINYPAELISTSAYPRYLSTHTCSTLSSHWSKKGVDWQKHGEAEPKGRWGKEALDQNFLFTYSIRRLQSVWMCVCACVAAIHVMPMEPLNYVSRIHTHTHTDTCMTENTPSTLNFIGKSPPLFTFLCVHLG